MRSDAHIRPAGPGDIKAILAIYAPYVRESTATFEYEVPALDAFRQRVAAISSVYPYYVLEADGAIQAYAYASRHAERAAYRYDVQTSVYVRMDARGRGYGKALYRRLFSVLSKLGYYTAYALISVPNPASVALHRAFGFEEIGLYRRTGYKFDAWLDVLWMEKRLGDFNQPPGDILAINEIAEDER